MESNMDRQSLQAVVSLMYQYGIFHGLLAGLTALIRGAYESEGIWKAIWDAALCVVIGTFVMYLPGMETVADEHPKAAVIGAMVIGIIGANLIITSIRDCFSAAIKQLNPLTWFKKAK